MAESNSLKRPKHENGEDIISSLPDSVLNHILSFLPTKIVVATSILSRKWRYTWTRVPYLYFDDITASDVLKKFQFTKFVDRVLILRTYPCIKRFVLILRQKAYLPHEIDHWICAAILHKVEVLDLHIVESTVELPRVLFSYGDKLRILKLHSGIMFEIPGSVLFSSLEVLHLRSLQGLKQDTVAKLLSGSPVLEELLIDRHPCDHVITLCIRSSSLKSFIISKTRVDEFLWNYRGECYKVIIDSPKLEVLRIEDDVSKQYDVIMVSSLVEATLNVTGKYGNSRDSNEYGAQLFQLLIQVSNAKTLRLSADMIKGHDDSGYYRFLDLDDQFLSQCFLSPLESLELRGFQGHAGEMKMVEYSLKHGKDLKKIRITHDAILEAELDVLKKILMFPRASSTCQVIFS